MRQIANYRHTLWYIITPLPWSAAGLFALESTISTIVLYSTIVLLESTIVHKVIYSVF
jgi:hypothetical protein